MFRNPTNRGETDDHVPYPLARATIRECSEEEQGYHKALKPRQIQMIAIGGAIGTGLFLGAGGRLATAGPALVFVYAVCGFFGFLILRALGELVLHRPSSGLVRLLRPRVLRREGGLHRRLALLAQLGHHRHRRRHRVALYMNFFKRYWPALAAVPQWVFALTALVVVLALNLVSVKVFGEMEFWFALIKVAALVGLPGDRHLLRHLRHARRRPAGRLQPDHRQRRLAAQRAAAGRDHRAGRGVRLRRDRAGRHHRRRDPEPGQGHAEGHQHRRRRGSRCSTSGRCSCCRLLLPYTAYEAGVSPFVTFFGSIGWTASTRS